MRIINTVCVPGRKEGAMIASHYKPTRLIPRVRRPSSASIIVSHSGKFQHVTLIRAEHLLNFEQTNLDLVLQQAYL